MRVGFRNVSYLIVLQVDDTVIGQQVSFVLRHGFGFVYVNDAHDLNGDRRRERDERHHAEGVRDDVAAEEVMGPLATPPESKAMPTNTDGT